MQAPQPPIRTDRLILRRPVRDDAAAVFSYSSDPLVTRLLTFPPSTDIAESRAFLARCDRMWSDGSAFPLGITLSDADRLIGMIELHPTDHGVELGYVLARAYWGNGYMPEAVRAVADWALGEPSVMRVSAYCDVDNAASQRVLEKAGFSPEGVLHRFADVPNESAEPRDAVMYARWR